MLDYSHHYLGVVNANAFEFGHQMHSNVFHFDIALAGTVVAIEFTRVFLSFTTVCHADLG